MKKTLFFKLIAAGVLFFSPQAHAAAALELSGTDYQVYIFCSEDLGGFCDQGAIKTDSFIFDGENFALGSFEQGWGGFLGEGAYSASGFSFNAHYEAIDGLDTYEFTVAGFTFFDIIMFGTMGISYTEYVVLNKDVTEGEAFFIGIKN